MKQPEVEEEGEEEEVEEEGGGNAGVFSPAEQRGVRGPRCDTLPPVRAAAGGAGEFSSGGVWSPRGFQYKKSRSLSVPLVCNHVSVSSVGLRLFTAAASSTTHASLKPLSVELLSKSWQRREAGRQTRNVPAPQLSTAPGEEGGREGGRGEEGVLPI